MWIEGFSGCNEVNSIMSLTRVLVVRDQAQDVPRLTVDVEAHRQFAERELHHKVGVPIRWSSLKVKIERRNDSALHSEAWK